MATITCGSRVYQDVNGNNDWVVDIMFQGNRFWVLWRGNKKPNNDEVEEILTAACQGARAMLEVCRESIPYPDFEF